ncbi:MAG TPA: VOC family protein [Bryobacteraceae bacterium]|nr:VOC family protein [Bryobacteraceae bacterium]
MKGITTYLNFDGNCREAMEFYGKCLGGDLRINRFADMPGNLPPDTGDRVMHAQLTNGARTLMASDTMPGMPFQVGNNFSIAIECESIAEIDKLFAVLGEKGKVGMPLQDTNWGARFGMLTDQFGVRWMFNYEHPKR